MGTNGTPTGRGIHFDGSVSETGGAGQGASVNNLRMQDVQVSGWTVGIDAYYVSNSEIINSPVSSCATGIKLYGSSNSVTFMGCPATSATTYGYSIQGGQACVIAGADVTTGGSAIGFELSATSTTIIDCRVECDSSGYHIEVTSGASATLVGVQTGNFGGTAAYALHNSGSTNAIGCGFSGATNAVLQEVGSNGQFISDNPNLVVDYYTSGSKTDSYAAQQLLSNPCVQDTFSLILRGGISWIDKPIRQRVDLRWKGNELQLRSRLSG